MKYIYPITLRTVVITTATFLFFSVTNAQVLSWSEDFSSEPADWVASGNSVNAGSGVSYDAANGRYDINAAGGGAGAPTFGLNGAGTANALGSAVDSYVAEITFDLIYDQDGYDIDTTIVVTYDIEKGIKLDEEDSIYLSYNIINGNIIPEVLGTTKIEVIDLIPNSIKLPDLSTISDGNSPLHELAQSFIAHLFILSTSSNDIETDLISKPFSSSLSNVSLILKPKFSKLKDVF